MSSRVLRKLQGDNKDIPVEINASDDEIIEENLSSSVTGARKKQLHVNRFDLLNEQSLSESEVKEDDDNETGHDRESSSHLAGSELAKSSSKRKKKKKKKKTVKNSANQRSSEDNMEGEDIDELTKMFANSSGCKPANIEHDGTRVKSLFSVDFRNLNPNNELKRIFGAKIVQSELARKKTRARNQFVKLGGLITPKDVWEPVGKQGLSMRYIGETGKIQLFTFEHSPDYQKIQREFLKRVESLDPHRIVDLVNKHPYHVDALLQLSDMSRMNEDYSMAAELVERALYALECAFHPLFNLAQGNCRLDYKRQENRSFFIALFKHLTYIGQRACHRTALELCKVLLSLDPVEDPLAVILVIDLFALRSRQYSWLIKVAEELESTRNLSQLPNFAFSIAIARFHMAQQTNVPEDSKEADEALQNALVMFPAFLLQLLEKCSVQTDSKFSSHPFFGPSAQTNMPPALGQLIALYVTRIWPVFKEPELLPWLEKNTHEVLARVEAKDPYVSVCEGHRKRRYQGIPPRNITRHILLADLKEVPPAIFAEDTSNPVLNFDPLPPNDSINIYEPPQNSRPTVNVPSNALTQFFAALLPSLYIDENGDWRQIDAPRPNLEEGAVGGARPDVINFRTIINDLLSNIQFYEPAERGDADVDSSDEEPGPPVNNDDNS